MKVWAVVSVAALMLVCAQLIPLASAEELSQLWSYEEEGSISLVSISTDGDYIVASSFNEIYLFNKDGKMQSWSHEFEDYNINSVSISSDGSYIVAGTSYFGDEGIEYGTVYLFETSSSAPRWSYQIPDEDDGVYSVSISPDGSYIAAGSYWEGSVYLLQSDGTLRWSYRPMDGSAVNSISISPDGNYVVAGRDDGVYLFNTVNGAVESYLIEDDLIMYVAISSTNHIVAGSYGGGVYFFEISGGAPSLKWDHQIEGEEMEEIKGLGISSNGENILVGTDYGKVYLFSSDGELKWSYDIDSSISSLSLAPDGDHLAVGDNYGLHLFSIVPGAQPPETPQTEDEQGAEENEGTDQGDNETPGPPDENGTPRQGGGGMDQQPVSEDNGAPEPPEISGPRVSSTDNQVLRITGTAGMGLTVKAYVNGALKAEVVVGSDNTYVVDVELDEGVNTVELSTATATSESNKVTYGSVTYTPQTSGGGQLPGTWVLVGALVAIGCVGIAAVALRARRNRRKSTLF